MTLTTRLAVEAWVLYGLGVVLVACRLVSRRIKLGSWKQLQIDDFLMIFALLCYSGVITTLNQVSVNGSNYLPPEVAANLSPEDRQKAVYGSIMTFVMELCTLTELWTVKCCLLILYYRLTQGVLTKQHRLVRFAMAYCGVSYVMVILLLLLYWCRPITQYWAVPVTNSQCASFYHHMIFATAFNISSDLMLFFIPIPIIMKTKLAPRRKLILCGILGLGVFNILAAVLNRYYNFNYPNSFVFLYWYVAETSMSIYVGNLPFCWPVLRLALGITDNTVVPVFATWRTRRKPMRKDDLLTTFATKLDLEEDHHEMAEEGKNHSETGSQIELVLRENQASHQHKTSVSAGSEVQRELEIPEGMATTWEESRDQANGGQGIIVVRTVNVSKG